MTARSCAPCTETGSRSWRRVSRRSPARPSRSARGSGASTSAAHGSSRPTSSRRRGQRWSWQPRIFRTRTVRSRTSSHRRVPPSRSACAVPGRGGAGAGTRRESRRPRPVLLAGVDAPLSAVPPRANRHARRSLRRGERRPTRVESGSRDACVLPNAGRVRAPLAAAGIGRTAEARHAGVSVVRRFHRPAAGARRPRPSAASARAPAHAARAAPRVSLPRRARAALVALRANHGDAELPEREAGHAQQEQAVPPAADVRLPVGTRLVANGRSTILRLSRAAPSSRSKSPNGSNSPK